MAHILARLAKPDEVIEPVASKTLDEVKKKLIPIKKCVR